MHNSLIQNKTFETQRQSPMKVSKFNCENTEPACGPFNPTVKVRNNKRKVIKI